MNKAYKISGGCGFRQLFGDLRVAQRTLSAYANFLESRGFFISKKNENSFYCGKDEDDDRAELIYVSEYSLATEVPQSLREFVTD